MGSETLRRYFGQAFWWVLSLGLFIGLWEGSYALGLYTKEVLPPPHVFLPDFPNQARSFDFGSQIAGEESEPNVALAILKTSLATIMRVVAGLGIGFTLGVLTGALIRYFGLIGKLTLPTITLLAPISPFAWLPVAVYLFGIGDAPAIFLVFVAVYFIIALATIAEIDAVSVTYLNVARIMGATRLQTFLQVVLPAVLPGLFVILRLNLFAAWMIVLIAESAGLRQRSRRRGHAGPQHRQQQPGVPGRRGDRPRRLPLRPGPASDPAPHALLDPRRTGLAPEMSSAATSARASSAKPKPAARGKSGLGRVLVGAIWWIASVGLFAGIWELCWYLGWANPMMMPPPHMFLQDFLEVGRLFDKSTRLGNPSAGLIALTIAKTYRRLDAQGLDRLGHRLRGQPGGRHGHSLFAPVRQAHACPPSTCSRRSRRWPGCRSPC